MNAIEDLGLTDALIWLAERGQASGEVPRPVDFETWMTNAEVDDSPGCLIAPKDFVHGYVEFSEAGRVFGLYVAHGKAASATTLSEPWAILNSISFQPASAN